MNNVNRNVDLTFESTCVYYE